MTPRDDEIAGKPVLKPIEGYTGLFAFENLERNPPEERKQWFLLISQTLKEPKVKKSKSHKIKKRK